MDVAQLLTKIVATVGTPGTPSATPEVVGTLIEAGVAVFRLNFSHGELDAHKQTLDMIRDAERNAGRPIGVLGDLCGPKIRVNQVCEQGVTVEPGQDVIFQREQIVATGPVFSSTYDGLIDDVQPGQKLLINDGAIRMLIVEKAADGNSITARVTHGGLITSRKGINLPNTDLSVDVITDRDWECLKWAVQHNLDFVALSFVRQADEIIRLKDQIEVHAGELIRRPLPVIAKIERPEAIENIESIIEAVDGIMVARGDLGVEMDLAEVPVIQKRLVRLASEHAKPCIVATQMLESMIHNATPTRAEASDVANAILDGADAVMLSGETAIGKYPVLTVDTMCRIAKKTEVFIKEESRQCTQQSDPPKVVNTIMQSAAWQDGDRCELNITTTDRKRSGKWTGALAVGAKQVVNAIDAKAIVTWSQFGVTAIHLSQQRFPVPILVCSDDESTLRRMTVLHGVVPIKLTRPDGLEAFNTAIDDHLLASGWVEPGDTVLLIAGWPIESDGTNSLAIHRIGDAQTGYH